MKRPLFSRPLSLALALTAAPFLSFAADHGDVPAAGNDPTADITDLYAWMSPDASKLNLVLDVYPNAGASASFSPAVVYAFSISSSQMYGGPQQSKKLLCKFVDATNVECWLLGEYVAGNPNTAQGITSASGKVRVYAGRRDDPFFLNYAGFNDTVTTAVQAAGSGGVMFDDKGCALLTPEQQTLLVGKLQHSGNDAPPTNTFAGQAVLALVLQVDKSLVDDGGPILGVWASTHSVK